jgi:hypothetical protein
MAQAVVIGSWKILSHSEHHEDVTRLLDGLRDLRSELGAPPQVAGVHPDREPERLQGLAQLGHEAVVRGRVRDEEHGSSRSD